MCGSTFGPVPAWGSGFGELNETGDSVTVSLGPLYCLSETGAIPFVESFSITLLDNRDGTLTLFPANSCLYPSGHPEDCQ